MQATSGSTQPSATRSGRSAGRGTGKTEEEFLLERALSLDPKALATLYDRHAPKLQHYLYRRLGDPDVADDLTGQVFLQMIQAIRDEKAWRTSFSGWLYRIAHNLMVDHLRKRSRIEPVSLDDAPPLCSNRGDPVAITDRTLAGERLVAAMEHLTDDQAQVLVLRFEQGMSIAETASAMDRSQGAIKALQHRAVVSLRRLLSEEQESQSSTAERGRSTSAEERTVWERPTVPATAA